MASTYVNDLRLNEMATGDGSGTWGTTTNTNLELIGEAFSYGTEAITTNADTHSTTIADGATDPGRSMYVKYTGTLDSTCTVSLLPNTVSKLWFIENATSGGFNLSIKQGSGAEIVIPNGDVKVVYSDGAGSGAAIFDALVDLNIATKLTVKNPATSSSPATVLLQSGDTDVAASDVLGKIQFQAPDEATGTDAILVAAAIEAVSEGDFSSSNNATKLAFKTGASEAATEKMQISSTGNVTMKQTATGDDTPMTLLLQTGEIDIAASDVLGKIEFNAPDEGTGTDALLVAGAIDCVSEGDFSSSSNASKLSFRTGASETATEKMQISSTGNVTMKQTATGDDTPMTLLLQTGELDVATADVLGKIQFQAPDEATGTDAILVAAEITAISEGDFSSSSNATKLAFKLGVSEAASEKASISSTGKFSCQDSITSVGGSVMVADGGTFGTVTTPTAIDIIGTGEVGMGAAGYTGAQTYIYDNTTGRIGLRMHLANAGSTQIGIYATTTGAGTAGYFLCSAGASGVYGQAAANYGVYGRTLHASYAGVVGYSGNNAHYGLLGHANAYGLYATSVLCVGAMSKGSGTFRIPHPLKSEIEDEPWDLCHSFIEGPQCDLIYRGKVDLVDGQASIDIDSHYDMTPGTFVWLTKADDVQTFTSNETGWDAVRSSFSGDTITIECQNASSTDTISWMVVAERGDPNIVGSTITDDEGNLLIERPSEPEPDLIPPPDPPSDP